MFRQPFRQIPKLRKIAKSRLRPNEKSEPRPIKELSHSRIKRSRKRLGVFERV